METEDRAIAEAFQTCFKLAPQYVAAVPGRINLVGEHVDYMGFSVLPAAMSQVTRVAVSCGKSDDAGPRVEIRNKLEMFTTRTFDEWKDVRINPDLHWTNYVVAALLGSLELMADDKGIANVGALIKSETGLGGESGKQFVKMLEKAPYGPLKIYVDGAVPIAAGVSSSAALCVASTLAITKSWGIIAAKKIKSMDFAQVCIQLERHAGLAAGGMDQATICLAKENKALHIHFDPLRADEIKLPENAKVVVTNSFCPNPKAATADLCYHKRVIECKLGCFILAKALLNKTLSHDEFGKVTFRTLLEAMKKDILNVDHLKELLSEIDKHIVAAPMTSSDVMKLIEDGHFGSLRFGPGVQKNNSIYEPHRRATHVINESIRVLTFRRICECEKLSDDEKLKKMGEIIDAADRSMSTIYDAGCAETLELTDAARQCGAYGARVIGAGWGGSTIALLPEAAVPKYMEMMKTKFAGWKARQEKNEESFKQTEKIPEFNLCCFVSECSRGARLIDVDKKSCMSCWDME